MGLFSEFAALAPPPSLVYDRVGIRSNGVETIMRDDNRDTKRIELDESKLLRLAGGRGDANPRMIGSEGKPPLPEAT
jgi:hypothetical protein